MERAFAVVLVVAAVAGTGGGVRHKHMTANVTQTLDYLLASDRYDKRLRPGFGGAPVTISVNFFIKSMGPVSDNEQSFGLDCYFRQHWYDLRLRYEKFPGLEELSMSWLFLDRVWKPDTYFINGKRSYLHRITVPNKFLRLRHDGLITYSMRLTISASCPMYLRKFPLDAQRCPLVLGSYGYSSRDVRYRWTEGAAIGLQPGVEIAQFDLVNVTTEGEREMRKGGLGYSTVQASFWLKRHTGYFMLQVYVPCGLMVVCSWISFWIDPEAVYVPCGLIVLSSWVSFWIDPDDVAARVALGVTTVLSLTTMGFGGRAQLPKVSYWTALDWFVIICFTSVFSVMIEYAIVNFIDKFKKDVKKLLKAQVEEEEAAAAAAATAAATAAAAAQEEEAPDAEGKAASLRRRGRSASPSLAPSRAEEEMERAVRAEGKPARVGASAAVAAYFCGRRRSRSIGDLRRGEGRGAEEAVEVAVDVEGRAVGEGAEGGRGRGRLGGLLRGLRHPRALWSKVRMPEQTELIRLVDGAEPASKFSRIDVQSRRNFPIAFFLSLVVYLFAFSYYLTDDIPARDFGVGFYN